MLRTPISWLNNCAMIRSLWLKNPSVPNSNVRVQTEIVRQNSLYSASSLYRFKKGYRIGNNLQHLQRYDHGLVTPRKFSISQSLSTYRTIKTGSWLNMFHLSCLRKPFGLDFYLVMRPVQSYFSRYYAYLWIMSKTPKNSFERGKADLSHAIIKFLKNNRQQWTDTKFSKAEKYTPYYLSITTLIQNKNFSKNIDSVLHWVQW